MKNTIIIPDYNQIWTASEEYFFKICGFDRTGMEDEESVEEAFSIREQYQEQMILRIILTIDWDRELCIYGMCIDEIAGMKDLDMLEQFYLDTWMTAVLDAGRDWLKEYIEKKLFHEKEVNMYVSDAFGPGFYGMGMEVVEDIIKEVHGDQIGIEYIHGSMRPPKSNVGFYRFSKDRIKMMSRDCSHCLAEHKNCMFCKNFK